MAYIIAVAHPADGSSTSLGAETRVDALLSAIDWLGGEIKWLKEAEMEDQCPAVKADGYADRLQDAIFSRWFDPIGGAA